MELEKNSFDMVMDKATLDSVLVIIEYIKLLKILF